MKEHKYHPKKLRSVILLLASSVFVAGGFFIRDEEPIFSWFGIVFFGLGILIGIIQLIPNSSYIKLSDEGFEVRSLWRSHFTKWSHIASLRKGSVRNNTMIFFDYTDEHKKWNTGKKVSKFLAGAEGSFLSNFTISTDKLLELMRYYKDNQSQLP